MTARETWPVAVPEADALTAPFWDATRDQRFVVQTCGCGHRQHPPRHVCHACGRMDGLGWTRASGGAVLTTFTEVHRSPAPELTAPYVVALVTLAEGPTVMTHLVDGDGWTIGDDVVVTWAPLPDGRHLPLFTRP